VDTGSAGIGLSEPSTEPRNVTAVVNRPVARIDTPPLTRVGYQSHDRLRAVRAGDTKERVFDLFGTTIEWQAGSVVRVDGMRLRARGRSPRYTRVEVADVTLADGGADGGLYWFLFGDGRLLVWGRPAGWEGTAMRYQLELEYPIGSSAAVRPQE
jgi:hypothetical protein